ncbi:hypothetical protein QE152_g24562 [Popillia japonica]|uniref:Integrase catalytic domain-containing protein n=1 Tax=Popillia japonica TaxID=7064 RepID=A0AAW1KFE4_POPJA
MYNFGIPQPFKPHSIELIDSEYPICQKDLEEYLQEKSRSCRSEEGRILDMEQKECSKLLENWEMKRLSLETVQNRQNNRETDKIMQNQAADNTKHRDPISVRELPSTPFENIDVDFAGPFPNGKYIFVDKYFRFPIAEIVNSTSSEHIQLILEALMGIPKVLLSDNGLPFNGNAIKEFLDTYGVKHGKITPYWRRHSFIHSLPIG